MSGPLLHCLWGVMVKLIISLCVLEQFVVCECDHLTDFSTLEETFDYLAISLSSFQLVRKLSTRVHIA